MKDQPTSIYSAASAASVLASKPLDSTPSPLLKPIPTPPLSSITTGQTYPTSETCGTSVVGLSNVLLLLREACLASLRASSDKCAVLLTSAGSGPKPSESYASFDPATVSLRTRQLSLLSKTGEPGTELCQNWSRAGLIVGGMYFPLPRLVQDISESVSSSSLPTPTTNDALKRGTAYWNEHREQTTFGNNLPRSIAALLPTPTARDYKDTPGMALEATNGRRRDDQLPRRIYATASPAPGGGMRLTPEFLCWLMGFPPAWLKPLVDALGTQSSRKSPSSSAMRSSTQKDACK